MVIGLHRLSVLVLRTLSPPSLQTLSPFLHGSIAPMGRKQLYKTSEERQQAAREARRRYYHKWVDHHDVRIVSIDSIH